MRLLGACFGICLDVCRDLFLGLLITAGLVWPAGAQERSENMSAGRASLGRGSSTGARLIVSEDGSRGVFHFYPLPENPSVPEGCFQVAGVFQSHNRCVGDFADRHLVSQTAQLPSRRIQRRCRWARGGVLRQDRRFDWLRQHFPVAHGADGAIAVGLCPRFAVTGLPRALIIAIFPYF
jgi:hypothetical protein